MRRQDDNGTVMKQCPKKEFMAQPICFRTGPCPLFLRITCVAPGATTFFAPSVTRAAQEAEKAGEIPSNSAHGLRQQFSYPTKPLKGAQHTMWHNVQARTAIHPPVFRDNSHPHSVLCMSLPPVRPYRAHMYQEHKLLSL